MSPLAKKLHLAAGSRAAIVNPPPRYLRRLEPLPEGVRVQSRATRGLDFVQVFAGSVAELRRYGPAAMRAVKPGGLLWVSYPKGGKTKGATDLPASPWWGKRDVLGEITGLPGYSIAGFVKIDETWSALRFKAPIGASRAAGA